MKDNADVYAFFQSFYWNPYTRSLLTPPVLTLQVPPALFQDQTGLPRGPPKKITPWRYMFMGMEVRRDVEILFQDFTLNFASIDEGIFDGRRAELSLKAEVPDLEVGSERAGRYLEVVQKIAEGKYFPWVGGRPVEPGAELD
jgi:hypothetical protein